MTPPPPLDDLKGGIEVKHWDEERFPKRKHPRLRQYDYSQPGYYFVTICTSEKRCIFGGPNKLNQFGQTAQQCMMEIEKHITGVRVDKWVVMPNHVHAIIKLLDTSANLSVIVGQYKSAVTKRIHAVRADLTVWQTSFHDHVIRTEQDYLKIWNYIHTNPMRWQEDCFFTE